MKKGFSYIDLIIIFGVFLVGCLILTPLVLRELETSKIQTIKQDAFRYIDTVDKQILINDLDSDNTNDITDAVYGLSELNAKDVLVRGTIPTGGTVSVEKGCVKDYTLEYNNYTVNYDEESNDVSIEKNGKIIKPIEKDIYLEDLLVGNDPVLKDNLIPIVIDSNGVVKKANTTEDWYSYESLEYANAVLLKENISKNTDEVILEDEILAYFVWIPKFSYKINNETEEIDISFSQIEDYILHPAFTSTGFWVGKFETGIDNVIKPNTLSKRNINVEEAFNIAYDYYRDFDSHMMKNTEWGAVAYFSSSKYGNKDITINASEYITGSGIDTEYNTEIPTQSTNANITGIYDMSGGTWEYMMSVVKDSDNNPLAGVSLYSTSGFNGLNSIDYTEIIDGSDFPDSKYFDLYTTGVNLLGDATSEIDSSYNIGWNNDKIYLATSRYPWYVRGGDYLDGVYSGLFRSKGCSGFDTDYTFRIILGQ